MKKILVMALLGATLLTTSVSAKVAATVNNVTITVAEANKALNILTKGKQTWATLPENGKKQLIGMMAPSKLVALKAEKTLTKKEKEAALAGFWMQKSMAQEKVSDKEIKTAYDKMKKFVKKSKSKKKLPTFDQIKGQLRMQLAQEKVITKLMKNAKLKIK